ncbi:hypothetical protein BO71DRAFT_395531 [Aspergillus ellipticus CBS 707.79]|uniref:Uncharacterized protein n=1 Tax=Aspergillus ellipticus CBS 707.79 TaxID=1448320 RepID=A0A319DL24_9EURO|nr:hypothetical protein BO71DRAFT_395531 [Aspergillus ellipticus CBS 707.79]
MGIGLLVADAGILVGAGAGAGLLGGHVYITCRSYVSIYGGAAGWYGLYGWRMTAGAGRARWMLELMGLSRGDRRFGLGWCFCWIARVV